MTAPPRFAAIDLGSNSFHLLLAQASRSGRYHILSRQRQKIRLADGLDETGLLSDEAIHRGLACLASFAEFLGRIPTTQVHCVATATLRKASNSEIILAQFERELGYPIEVISGEREAALIYQGATQTLPTTTTGILVLDIGGASTEIIAGDGAKPRHLKSLDMGCVIWQSRFFSDQTITATACQAATEAASAIIRPHRDRFRKLHWRQVCGASGTFRALYDILQHQRQPLISACWLQDIVDQAISYGHIRHLGKLGIHRDRQAVFMGGVSILLALVNELDLDNIKLAKGALREGLLQNLLTSTQTHRC